MTAPSCICSAFMKAQNKSLLTANEKLLAENEKLKSENEAGRVENGAMRTANQKLLAENEKLKVEKAAGRVENGAMRTANQKLLTENQRLKLEVGTFRLLISQMRLLRERELSESSETGSEGEEEEVDSSSNEQRNNSVSNSRSEGDEEDVDPKSSDPPTPETVSDSSWDEDDNKLSDSDSDIEMETDDRRDEIDEVDEADDDLDSSDDDDEENKDERDDSLWKRKCSWKCANCLKEICGTRTDRLKHIAMHNSFKIQCPLDGCNVFLGFTTSKSVHLQRTHQIELGQLSQTQKRHFRVEQARYYKKSKEQEREFFPEENIGKLFKLANDTCKKCDAKVVTYIGQTRHVAAHLELKVKCPLAECKSVIVNLYVHLRSVHNLKLHKLDESAQESLKKSNMHNWRAVNKVRSEYF